MACRECGVAISGKGRILCDQCRAANRRCSRCQLSFIARSSGSVCERCLRDATPARVVTAPPEGMDPTREDRLQKYAERAALSQPLFTGRKRCRS